MRKENYFEQFFPVDSNGFSIIIEDDGLVAYAYLLKDEEIVSTLWLYNVGKTLYNNWENLDKHDLPFQNLDYFISKQIESIKSKNDINIKWVIEKNYTRSYIFIFNELIGFLDSTTPIGYSLLVTEDGPLANKYSIQ